jgi:hypothetical protein
MVDYVVCRIAMVNGAVEVAEIDAVHMKPRMHEKEP